MIIYPDTSFWFLWVLFLISVTFVTCQWMAKQIKCDELLFIGLSCAILFGVMVLFDIRVFGFQFLAYYILFYTAGYCIHRYSLNQRIRNKIVLASLFLVWCILAWYWNMHSLPNWMPTVHFFPSSLLQYTYRGVTGIIAILIKEIGTLSLGLYVCHLSLMGSIVRTIKEILPSASNFIIIIIGFIVGFSLSLIIVELLKSNKHAAKYLLGKIK